MLSDGRRGWPYLYNGLDAAKLGMWRKMKKVMLYIIVGVVVLFAAAIIFVVLSPDYDARIIRSESMKPALQIGDVVIMGPVGSIGDIEPGMVIGFTRGDATIAHRVVSVEKGGIQTAGDVTGDPDPWLVPFSDVYGVMLFKIPYIGYVSKYIRTTLGWVLLIIIPGVLLLGYLMWDLFRKKEPKKAVPVKVRARARAKPNPKPRYSSSSAKARLRRERRQRAMSDL